MKFALILPMSVAILISTGCANITVPAPQPTATNVNAAKQSPESIKVGTFKLAPGLNTAMDQSISVRGGNTLSTPDGKGFAAYLRDTLVTELRAANKLNDTSSISISGELTRSELDAGVSTGTATLGARFVVQRTGSICLDKNYIETAQWESSFMAAVAVPTAFNQYTALYPKLAGQLLSDSEFQKGCLAKQ